MKTFTLVLAMACTLPAAPSVAADPTASESASAAISRSGEVDLRMLLRELGPRLHKRFVWDPRIVQSIDLGNLDRKEMTYPELLSLLGLHRMAVVQCDGVWQVMVTDDIRQAATPLVAPGSIKTLDDEWITTVLPVRNLSAMQLVPMLRPFVPTQGQLVALPDRNALVIVDRSANTRRLIDIIKTLEDLPKVSDPAAAKNP